MADANFSDEQRRHSRMVLYQVSLGLGLVAINHRAIQIALPTLTNVFHSDLSFIQWVLLVYDLCVIGLVLTLGRLGDLFGRKWIYVCGFLIFVAGSALCGAAQSSTQLVLFRVLQGIGGAMIMANGRALVTVNSPVSERGKALGITSMAFHVGYITGPTLGGFIIDAAGWRWVFFLTLPLGLACAYFGWRILKERPATNTQVQVDFAGAAYLLLTNSCFLYALNRLPHRGTHDLLVITFFVVATVALFLFIRTELKAPTPILSLSLFRNRLFTAANLSLFFLTSTQAAVSLLIPFYLQKLMGFTPTQMGWILIGGSVVIVVLAPIAGRLSDRFGSRLLCTVGAGIMIVGQYLIGSLTLQSSVFQMVMPQLLIGLGWALFNSPNQSAIMNTVPRDKVGAASGMTLTTARIGGAMGVAISSAIMTYALGANGLSPEQIESPASWAAAPEVFLKSFKYTTHWITAFAVLSVVFAAMRGARKD